MNIAQAVSADVGEKSASVTRAKARVPKRDAEPQTNGRRVMAFFGRVIVRLLRGEQRQPSILRNNTNLPIFLVIALLISVVCNFALKENSAQASRYAGPSANLRAVLALVAMHPDDPTLHSQLGELYIQQHNYRRAMFHLREASRLTELYGE